MDLNNPMGTYFYYKQEDKISFTDILMAVTGQLDNQDIRGFLDHFFPKVGPLSFKFAFQSGPMGIPLPAAEFKIVAQPARSDAIIAVPHIMAAGLVYLKNLRIELQAVIKEGCLGINWERYCTGGYMENAGTARSKTMAKLAYNGVVDNLQSEFPNWEPKNFASHEVGPSLDFAVGLNPFEARLKGQGQITLMVCNYKLDWLGQAAAEIDFTESYFDATGTFKFLGTELEVSAFVQWAPDFVLHVGFGIALKLGQAIRDNLGAFGAALEFVLNQVGVSLTFLDLYVKISAGTLGFGFKADIGPIKDVKVCIPASGTINIKGEEVEITAEHACPDDSPLGRGLAVAQLPQCEGCILHKAGESHCPTGMRPLDESACRERGSGVLVELGKAPERPFKIGSWGDDPSGCMIKTGGDHTVMFNKAVNGAGDDNWSLVCVKNEDKIFTRRSQCPKGWRGLTLNECEQRAGFLIPKGKKQGNFIRDSITWAPPGCSLLWSWSSGPTDGLNVIFNDDRAGVNHGTREAYYELACTPSTDFVMETAANECPGGSRPMNPSECSARAVLQVFDGRSAAAKFSTGEDPKRPSGCSLRTGGANPDFQPYYNTLYGLAETGERKNENDGNYKLVCVAFSADRRLQEHDSEEDGEDAAPWVDAEAESARLLKEAEYYVASSLVTSGGYRDLITFDPRFRMKVVMEYSHYWVENWLDLIEEPEVLLYANPMDLSDAQFKEEARRAGLIVTSSEPINVKADIYDDLRPAHVGRGRRLGPASIASLFETLGLMLTEPKKFGALVAQYIYDWAKRVYQKFFNAFEWSAKAGKKVVTGISDAASAVGGVLGLWRRLEHTGGLKLLPSPVTPTLVWFRDCSRTQRGFELWDSTALRIEASMANVGSIHMKECRAALNKLRDAESHTAMAVESFLKEGSHKAVPGNWVGRWADDEVACYGGPAAHLPENARDVPAWVLEKADTSGIGLRGPWVFNEMPELITDTVEGFITHELDIALTELEESCPVGYGGGPLPSFRTACKGHKLFSTQDDLGECERRCKAHEGCTAFTFFFPGCAGYSECASVPHQNAASWPVEQEVEQLV
jgi:hypothetical protein